MQNTYLRKVCVWVNNMGNCTSKKALDEIIVDTNAYEANSQQSSRTAHGSLSHNDDHLILYEVRITSALFLIFNLHIVF